MRLLTSVVSVLLLFSSCKHGDTSRLFDEFGGDPDYAHRLAVGEPGGLFASTGFGKTAWVKFIIRLDEPDKVYFQNSNRFPYHYDFATSSLPGYSGMSRDAFDAVSLKKEGQKLLLGAVLVPGKPEIGEFAIQFVGLDPYDAAFVTKYYRVVMNALEQDPERPLKPYYFPVAEQRGAAERDRGILAQAGITVGDPSRWISGNQCYTQGWAYGRLKYFPREEIEDAYAAGKLKPDDILLTDDVPAELPYLAGIYSLRPSTPNSHVALLAESFDIPFAYVGTQEDRALFRKLVGREVGISHAEGHFGGCELKVRDLDGRLSSRAATYLRELKRPPKLEVKAYRTSGRIFVSTDGLTPAAISRVGGKAAGFGLLRKAIPEASPEAIALTFDVWERFMAQEVGGTALGEKIRTRLDDYGSYPPHDMAALKKDLKQIRKWIEDAPFPADLAKEVLEALKPFDPQRKIRFRSSTNVEDSENFSGAGLYDSASGCLADDLDDDDKGPSHCEPEESKERGVFRAIRKVFASFYNDNAFLERLRHRVDESEVGMAVLVHYSFPDDEELANGVITFKREFGAYATIVSQPRALSVTNPEEAGAPEVVEVADWGHGEPYFSVQQYSSAAPTGRTVLEFEREYQELYALVRRVDEAFRQARPDLQRYKLDLEYKKDVRTGLVIKQVRLVPQPAHREIKPYLVAGKARFCTFQGERSDVFSIHHTKGRFNLEFKEALLDSASEPLENLITHVSMEYRQADGKAAKVEGSVESLPGGAREEMGLAFDLDFGDHAARARIATWRQQFYYWDGMPLIMPEEVEFLFDVAFDKPRPGVASDGSWSWVIGMEKQYQSVIRSCTFDEPLPAGAVAKRREILAGPIKIVSEYWYPPYPKGVTAGYTAPLIKWKGTVIEGLLDEPIRLKDYYSQSKHPGHHNFSASFMFEPRLEPGIPASVVKALEDKGVRYIWATTDNEIKLIGPDGNTQTVRQEN